MLTCTRWKFIELSASPNTRTQRLPPGLADVGEAAEDPLLGSRTRTASCALTTSARNRLSVVVAPSAAAAAARAARARR